MIHDYSLVIFVAIIRTMGYAHLVQVAFFSLSFLFFETRSEIVAQAVLKLRPSSCVRAHPQPWVTMIHCYPVSVHLFSPGSQRNTTVLIFCTWVLGILL